MNNNREDYTLFVREYKYEEERNASIHLRIDYTSKDRQYVRDIDDCLSNLCQRLNEGGFDEFNKFVEVIDAWLNEGVHEDFNTEDL